MNNTEHKKLTISASIIILFLQYLVISAQQIISSDSISFHKVSKLRIPQIEFLEKSASRCYELQDYTNAIKILEEAVRVCKGRDTVRLGIIFTNLALIYLASNDLKKIP